MHLLLLETTLMSDQSMVFSETFFKKLLNQTINSKSPFIVENNSLMQDYQKPYTYPKKHLEIQE